MLENADQLPPNLDLSAPTEESDVDATAVPVWSPEPEEPGSDPTPEIPVWEPAQADDTDLATPTTGEPNLESPVPVMTFVEPPEPHIPVAPDPVAPDLVAPDPVVEPRDIVTPPSDETDPNDPQADEIHARVDELASSLRELVISGRDAATRQAWAEAAAWAEEHVATELSRLQSEADERLSQELARLGAETARQRAEESVSIERTIESRVNERVEETLEAARAAQDRALQDREAELQATWEARLETAVDSRLREAAEAIAAERVERAVEETRAAQQATIQQLQTQAEANAAARMQVALADAARAQAAEIARVKAQAEELLAQRFYGGLESTSAPESAPCDAETADGATEAARVASARQEERQAVVAEIDRLRRGMSRLDDARSLGEVLDALGAALRSEVSRLVIVKVSDVGATLWHAYGFDPSLDPAMVVEDTNQPGLLGRVIETGVPSFADPSDAADANRDVGFAILRPDAVALAVPILVGGRPVAIAYGDDSGMIGGASKTWPEVFGVLARHASRCLDALSALMRASGTQPEPSAEAFGHGCDVEDAADEPSAAADPSTERAPHDGDRRASTRKRSSELPWLGPVDLQPGHNVSLVNVSNGGALVEAGSRLAPGTSVLLQFIGQQGQRVRGQVMRCAVFTLSDGTVKYRGAVKFSEPLSAFFERAAQDTRQLDPVAGTVEVVPIHDGAGSSASPA